MISVITPSCRPKALGIIEMCLSRQSHADFEWIVVTPESIKNDIFVKPSLLLTDPPKREGDFWRLCGGWNRAYQAAKGDLILNIQDNIWFGPDTLLRFWSHFKANPKALVTAIGHQYDHLDERGKPDGLIWNDPRLNDKLPSFRQVGVENMEMAMCSVPRQAIFDCGGIDEEYDKGPGLQEKEMVLRLRVLGYEAWLDESIEYRALTHGRLTDDWDDKYWTIAKPLFEKHMRDFLNETRPLKMPYVHGV